MRVASLGFRTDVMVRRLAGATVIEHGDHLVVRTPQNPSFYWGNFLLLGRPPAAGEAARWLEVFATAFPEARHVAIGIDSTDGAAGDVSGFLDAGLRLDVGSVLTAASLRHEEGTSRSASWRRLRSDTDWQQVVDLRLAVYEPERSHAHDDTYGTFVRRSVAEMRRLAEQGHCAYFGAFVDEVVRSSLGIVSDGSGLARYHAIETHPRFRRRGLASTLLVAAGDYARERFGARTLVIVADPAYVAIDLYRRLGFSDTERQVQLERPAP